MLPRQRAILERLNRQRTVERRLAERVQVVLWSAGGKPSVEQAAALGVDPQRVLRWRHRWRDESARLAEAERSGETTDEKLEALTVDVLSDEERSGSPGKFTAEQLAHIVSLACEDPAELGLPITHWVPRELALEAQRRGIVPSISARHVARFFGGGGATPASLFVYTPKHCSWLNKIECWFSILVRRALKRGSFSSKEALATRIRDFIDYFNRLLAKPFRWTYSGRPLSV